MKKGFTLLELLIVVIIVGILASIAVPQFLNAVEKTRVAKAKSNLGLIAHAEKMYRSEKDTYIEVTAKAANETLGNYIELQQVDADMDWNYTVGEISATSFTATATKKEGTAHAAETINMTQDGICSGTHSLRGQDCGGN